MSPLTAPGAVLRSIDREGAAHVARQLEAWLGQRGLAATYPQVFGADADAELLGLFDGARLVSHAATRAVGIATPHGDVRALLVGSVATAPDRRGEGLASALLAQIATRARIGGHDALLLWSDRWTFYARAGFAPSGAQLEVELAGRPGLLAAGLRPARACDLPALLALHRRKPLAARRDLGTLALLLAAAPMTTVVLERAGTVAAYACCGKGLDFSGWWHEVGGDDADVAALVSGAMDLLGQRRATLLLPPYRAGVLAHLAGAVQAQREGAAALCRPLTERGKHALFVDGLDSI